MFAHRAKVSQQVTDLKLAATYLSDGMLELTDDDRDCKTASVFFERAIHYASLSQKSEKWDNHALEIIMGAYLGQVQHVLGLDQADARDKAIEITRACIAFYKEKHDINHCSFKFYITAAAASSYYLMNLATQNAILREPAFVEFLQSATDILSHINEKMQQGKPPQHTENEIKQLGTIYYQHAVIVQSLSRFEITLDYCYHAIQAYVVSNKLSVSDCTKLAEIYGHLATWFQDHPIFAVASDYFSGEEVDLIDLTSHANEYDVRTDLGFRISAMMLQFLHLAKDKVNMVPDTMLKYQLMRDAVPDEYTQLLEKYSCARNHTFPTLIIKPPTSANESTKIKSATHKLVSPKPHRTLSFSKFFKATVIDNDSAIDLNNKNSL